MRCTFQPSASFIAQNLMQQFLRSLFVVETISVFHVFTGVPHISSSTLSQDLILEIPHHPHNRLFLPFLITFYFEMTFTKKE